LTVYPSRYDIISTKTDHTMMMRFSRDASPRTLVFGDVKIVRQFEGCHPHRNNLLQVRSLKFGKLGKTDTLTVSWSCGKLAATTAL